MREARHQRRVTMQDIARRADVSQSTVSFVLNDVNGMRIADATKARVREIAAELGYMRRAPGGHELGQLHPTIGMLVDEVATSTMTSLSIDGAHEAAWSLGRTLVIAKTGGNKDQEDAVIESWRAQAVEGIIYSTVFTRSVKPPPTLDNIPTVLLNCHAKGRRFPSVIPSEVMGGYTATQALLDAGHRRIGFINGDPWMEAAVARRTGYRRALASYDVSHDPALDLDGTFLPSSGYERTLELLALRQPPTAIFCANDMMALGCYEALKENGVRIPGDMAVMGYDDQEVAQHLFPALSTVLLPHAEMGRWAADHLITTWLHGQGAPTHIKLECPLVKRDSI